MSPESVCAPCDRLKAFVPGVNIMCGCTNCAVLAQKYRGMLSKKRQISAVSRNETEVMPRSLKQTDVPKAHTTNAEGAVTDSWKRCGCLSCDAHRMSKSIVHNRRKRPRKKLEDGARTALMRLKNNSCDGPPASGGAARRGRRGEGLEGGEDMEGVADLEGDAAMEIGEDDGAYDASDEAREYEVIDAEAAEAAAAAVAAAEYAGGAAGRARVEQ